jgi:hypothetical protein
LGFIGVPYNVLYFTPIHVLVNLSRYIFSSLYFVISFFSIYFSKWHAPKLLIFILISLFTSLN